MHFATFIIIFSPISADGGYIITRHHCTLATPSNWRRADDTRAAWKHPVLPARGGELLGRSR